VKEGALNHVYKSYIVYPPQMLAAMVDDSLTEIPGIVASISSVWIVTFLNKSSTVSKLLLLRGN
jgi:hypothetical protein